MSKESLFERLAKNAKVMGEKGLIDNAKMDARNAAIENQLREAAGYDQLRLEWYKKMLREESAKLWEQQHPQLRIGDYDLKSVNADGRFKTLYETGNSGGSSSKTSRNQTENKLFGTNNHVLDRELDPNLNPVYGFADGDASMLHQYGDNAVLLSPNVKDRMTYSIGDSLDDGLAGRYGFGDWTSIVRPEDVGYVFSGHESELKDKVARVKREYESGRISKRTADKQLETLNHFLAGLKEEGDDYMNNLFDKIQSLKNYNNGTGFEDAFGDRLPYIENQYHGGLSADDIEKVIREEY